ncbi:MAG TPA: DUF4382 domain-containing protein [Dehalococcoidia bacterium]|nr:DUF4382 domain-containing protein [Dehalococcoidia bacterium]
MKKQLAVLTALSMLSVFTIGCTGEPSASQQESDLTASIPAGSGMLRLYVADPPAPDMDAILVDIANIEAHMAEGVGWINIAENPGQFDLKELYISELEEFLASQIVDAGKYTQIRFDVETVTIVVGEDEFDAKVPSGKIKLVGEFEVPDGGIVTVTLDFNGEESVLVTGNGQYMFKPVIKLIVDGEVQPTELEYELTTRGEETVVVAEESGDVTHNDSETAVHLRAVGETVKGDEARIVVFLPEEMTLADIESIAWWEYLVAGYPPHVDIIIDVDESESVSEDALVFEYAYNYTDSHYNSGETPAYGAKTGGWYQTFSDDDGGPLAITVTDTEALGWLSSQDPGPPGAMTFYAGTLTDWQAGDVDTSSLGFTVNGSTPVLRLEIEIDDWIAETEAFVDDIEIIIGGVTYTIDFE